MQQIQMEVDHGGGQGSPWAVAPECKVGYGTLILVTKGSIVTLTIKRWQTNNNKGLETLTLIK